MLQVSRTAVKFASTQQQLVQRVVRKKGEGRGETNASNNMRGDDGMRLL